MATVADYLADQVALTRKIRNSYANLLKEGRARITLGSIESRLTNLEANMQAFRENHDQLLALMTDADAEKAYFKDEQFDRVEDEFLDLRGKFLDERMLLCQPSSAPVQNSGNAPANRGELAAPARKMPPIPLPKFSGKHTDWIAFRDLFRALVVDARMTGVEKFSYLRDSLSDDPYVLIKNISVTEDNFDGAWQKLVEQYDNNKTLIYTHVRELLSLAPMTSENVCELKRLLNSTIDSLESLKALSSPVDQWDHFSVPLTVGRLDHVSRRAWELETARDPNPATFDKLRAFLRERLTSLEVMDSNASREIAKSSGGQSQGRKNSANSLKSAKSHNACKKLPSNSGNSSCSLCNQPHYIASCSVFKGKAASARLEYVKVNRLCFNCLGRHLAENCKTTKTCFVCHDKHHTLLHDSLRSNTHHASHSEQSPNDTEEEFRPGADVESTAARRAPLSSHTASSAQHDAVLLGTAIVQIESTRGKTSYARALIDPGSEISLIAESLVKRMRLPREEAAIPITGVGDASSLTKGSAQFVVCSRVDTAASYQVDAYILPRLTSYSPRCVRAPADWTHLQGLSLADPHFASDAPIELLFGVDLFQLIIQDGVVKSAASGPVGQKTSLGWILTYSAPAQRKSATSQHVATPSRELTNADTLDQLLQRFWETEAVPAPDRMQLMSAEEQECERHFLNTFSRDPAGRFEVRLPMKTQNPKFPGSFRNAKRSLARLERRFSVNPELQAHYEDFMNEYLGLGHMTIIGDEHTVDPDILNCSYFIPHHGIFQGFGPHQKFRVVFNASVQDDRNVSLNDVLHVGQALQTSITLVYLRWRMYRCVYCADISKMYRRVAMYSADRRFQRILFRFLRNGPILIIDLNTVTYGLAPSAFQALRSLRQLALEERSRFPRVAKFVEDNMYVDDAFFGADSIEEAIFLAIEFTDFLMAGSFPLRKWAASDPRLLAHIPTEWLAEKPNGERPMSPEHRLMGLVWNQGTDDFSFSANFPELGEFSTRRQVASLAAKLYDPLGLASPLVVRAKIFLQTLWTHEVCENTSTGTVIKRKLDWDDQLPPALAIQWQQIYSDLRQAHRVRVPRWLSSGPRE